MPDTSQSPSSRRDRSRRALLAAVREGASTRPELAARTGLSRSAVAAGVADLLAAGIVAEEEDDRPATGRRGRSPARLRAARPAGHVVGIDFGHAHTRVALADTAGTVVAEVDHALDVDGHALAALDTVAEDVRRLASGAGLGLDEVLAVAAGIPGPLDRQRQTVSSPTILSSWIDLNPVEELTRRLGRPVWISNDADMGATGEMLYGAAHGYRDFLYIKASHGIGASLVLDGRCYGGSVGIAGEIGHTQLPGVTNRCRCGNQGCLEAVISVQEVRRQLAHTHLLDQAEAAGTTLAEAAADLVGARILAEAGRTVGRVVADGCNWLNPAAIVLGGELGASGRPFLEGFRDSLDRYAQPATAAAVDVVIAHLGLRAEVMGAVGTAVSRCEEAGALGAASASG